MGAVELITQKYNYSFPHENRILSGKINLTLSAYSDDGFGHWLPHLSHSRKTNQFDVQLQDIKTNSGFNCSRFAIELVLVSNNEDKASDFPDQLVNPDDSGKGGSDQTTRPNLRSDSFSDGGADVIRQKTTTLDDEHTPGIFSTEELILPGINDSLKSYMQWRPIVYTTMERELSSSSGLHVMPAVAVKNAGSVYNNTLIYVLYGSDLDEIVVRAVNVSFGVKDDGFYRKTKYLAWTFTFGTGDPIRNGLSSKIIMAIIVLVFVTIVTCAVGLGFCLHNRSQKNRQAAEGGAYTRMNNDQGDANNSN